MSDSIARKAIEQAHRFLAQNDPIAAAYTLRDLPEVEATELGTMARHLASGEYGCHKNDVLGLIEYLEAWMNKELQ